MNVAYGEEDFLKIKALQDVRERNVKIVRGTETHHLINTVREKENGKEGDDLNSSNRKEVKGNTCTRKANAKLSKGVK